MPVESLLQGEAAAEDRLDELRAALGRLDERLRGAVARARAEYGPGAETDPHRGLYVDDDEAARLLAREPAAPLLASETMPPPLASGAGAASALTSLGEALGLAPFDLDVVVIALAPELDLRYERLYAYLQDDVTRRRPTVDLALQLLCRSADERLARRARFAPDAPLVRHAVLELVAEAGQPEPPLLARALKVDERVVRHLLGHDGPDGRLEGVCRRIVPEASLDELDVSEQTAGLLAGLAARLRLEREPLRLLFEGPPGVGKRLAAEALARDAGLRLLTFDVGAALAAGTRFARLLQLALRETRLDDSVLYLSGTEHLRAGERAADEAALLDALAETSGVVVVASLPGTVSGAPAAEP